jgi:hypothetical protein
VLKVVGVAKFEPFEKFVVKKASSGEFVDPKLEWDVNAHVTVASSSV